jgi:hypothetical protein
MMKRRPASPLPVDLDHGIQFAQWYTRGRAVPFRGVAADLKVLGGVLFLDALGAGRGALLVKLGTHGSVNLLLEDGLGLDGLELGLEVFGSVGAGVASATRIVHIVAIVVDFIAIAAPVRLIVVSDVMLDIGSVKEIG